jgi:hypothetical protein
MQVSLPDPPLQEGFLIFGNSVSPTEFQGVVTHSLFRTIVPLSLSEWGVIKDNVSGLVALLAQRKKKNTTQYAQYMIEMVKSGEGFTPQIVLYSNKSLRVETDPNTGLGWLLVPHEIKFVPLDGGTQTRARHFADDLELGLLNKENVKIVIKHGVSVSIAQQIFVDCKRVGGTLTTSMALGMDNRDDASQLVKLVEEQIPVLAGKVNRQKRQIGAKDKDIITISALRAAVVCFLEGISSIQAQDKPVHVDDTQADELRTAAVQWFTAATAAMNGALMPEERANSFASAPAVWCAIGALGRDAFIELSGAALEKSVTPAAALRRAFKAFAETRLAKVDWSRGNHWLSAGAKQTASGKTTLGGPKETGSSVYKALKDGTLMKKSTSRSP